MNYDIYVLLNSIEEKDYKAYVVGGFVRDHLLGFSNTDVDIVTDAPVEVIKSLFFSYNPQVFKNNTVMFKYLNYDIDIAQIREETYENGLVKVTFTSDLEKDYNRRDFTINALYMDKDGNTFDYGTSEDDINNLRLKFIGDSQEKCVNDPSRILRGIYFILKYDLKDYSDLFSVKLSINDFKSCDINLLNKSLYKILKLNKNGDFVLLLDKCNIYDILFKNRSNNNDLKPIDFLKNNEYIFIDSITGKI